MEFVVHTDRLDAKYTKYDFFVRIKHYIVNNGKGVNYELLSIHTHVTR
jgi:hypothetical protein